jgi:hypothetical protein
VGRGAVSDLPLHLRLIRAALRRLNTSLSRRRERGQSQSPAMAGDRLPEVEAALRKLRLDDPAAQAYFDKHLPRLAKTLSLVPPPHGTARALELGCYMQITPALKYHCGYREVYGADYGAGPPQHKSAQYGDATSNWYSPAKCWSICYTTPCTSFWSRTACWKKAAVC